MTQPSPAPAPPPSERSPTYTGRCAGGWVGGVGFSLLALYALANNEEMRATKRFYDLLGATIVCLTQSWFLGWAVGWAVGLFVRKPDVAAGVIWTLMVVLILGIVGCVVSGSNQRQSMRDTGPPVEQSGASPGGEEKKQPEQRPKDPDLDRFRVQMEESRQVTEAMEKLEISATPVEATLLIPGGYAVILYNPTDTRIEFLNVDVTRTTDGRPHPVSLNATPGSLGPKERKAIRASDPRSAFGRPLVSGDVVRVWAPVRAPMLRHIIQPPSRTFVVP